MKMASHPYSVGLFLAAHGGVGFMSICPQTVLEIRRRLGGITQCSRRSTMNRFQHYGVISVSFSANGAAPTNQLSAQTN